MIDWILIKDVLALAGIIWVSSKIVIGIASLADKINLWGIKKGMRKWLES